jgi:hypothetical protein
MQATHQVEIDKSLKPIDPNLDISVIDLIAKRRFYVNSYAPIPASSSTQSQ